MKALIKEKNKTKHGLRREDLQKMNKDIGSKVIEHVRPENNKIIE